MTILLPTSMEANTSYDLDNPFMNIHLQPKFSASGRAKKIVTR